MAIAIIPLFFLLARRLVVFLCRTRSIIRLPNLNVLSFEHAVELSIQCQMHQSFWLDVSRVLGNAFDCRIDDYKRSYRIRVSEASLTQPYPALESQGSPSLVRFVT